MKGFVVITSIFPPNAAVRRWAEVAKLQLVVVGDLKTPPDWCADGVVYLSPDMQRELPFDLARALPWNHYSRKMLGYLYCIAQGAELIVDTDDDNVPTSDWTTLPQSGVFPTLDTGGFVNVYRWFGGDRIWPRGYPLRRIRETDEPWNVANRPARIGVWQFLADGSPDVDAIYRLVSDEPIRFEKAAPVVLDEGTLCPFNSQNTVFSEETFPLLYLPALVTFRFTDILRGLVAQPLLWRTGLRLGFGPATVFQDRNDHDYLDDFRSELPMYLHTEEVVATAAAVADEAFPLTENLSRVYRALAGKGIVESRELELLDCWLGDLALARSLSLDSTEVAA